MLAHPTIIGPPAFLAVYRQPVRAGFPSPADDYLDAPIDLSRALINAPAAFIMTVAGDSAVAGGIFDGSLITVDRSLRPRDGAMAGQGTAGARYPTARSISSPAP